MKFYFWTVLEGTNYASFEDASTFPDDWEPRSFGWAPSPIFFGKSESSRKERKETSFVAVGTSYLVLREPAYVAVRHLLTGSGELVRLPMADVKLWAFHPSPAIPALDHEASRIRYFPNSKKVMLIEEFAFVPEVIGSRDVFVIADSPKIFFSQTFVDCYHGARLTGLGFVPVWDSESGPIPWLGRRSQSLPLTSTSNEPSPEPTLVEAPLSDNARDEIVTLLGQALNALGLPPHVDPLQAVRAIERHVATTRPPRADRGADMDATHVLEWAYLFGEQIRRAYGWEWTGIEEKHKVLPAVVSPDRAAVHFPIEYLHGQFTQPDDEDLTIELLFNMLAPAALQTKQPPLEPGGMRILG